MDLMVTVTDINVPRNTPIVAVRDMEFFFEAISALKIFAKNMKIMISVKQY